MHQLRRAYDLATERLANRLMAQADAQNWNAAGKALDYLQRNSGAIRCARARRDYDPFGEQLRFDLLDCDLIVAAHLNGLAQFAEILNQVVGERIVVVDDEEHVVGLFTLYFVLCTLYFVLCSWIFRLCNFGNLRAEKREVERTKNKAQMVFN